MPFTLPDEITKEPALIGVQKIILYKSAYVTVLATLASTKIQRYVAYGQPRPLDDGKPNNHRIKIEVKYKSYDTDENNLVTRTVSICNDHLDYMHGRPNWFLEKLQKENNSIVDYIKKLFDTRIFEADTVIKRAKNEYESQISKQNYFKNVITRI